MSLARPNGVAGREWGRRGEPGSTARRASADARAPGKRTRVEQLAAARARHGDRGTESPTIEDVATEAVDRKGAGAALDPGVRAPAEARLATDLGAVRVHTDVFSAAATTAMGARAFTYGADVFLAAGESPSDARLMGHELTHVAQQGAAGTASPHRKVEVGAADHPSEREADEIGEEIAAGKGAPGGRLVRDDATPAEGQLRIGEFLALLRKAVEETANATLGPEWSAKDCPYLHAWFARHEGGDPAAIERLVARYARTSSVAGARDYVAPACARLAGDIARWKGGEDVSAELTASGLADAAEAVRAAPRPGAPKQAQRRPGPEAVAAELGDGAALDGTTASRMQDAFGRDFSDVRVHTDAVAARMVSDERAIAFTVGTHVAFAPGAYRPGTPHGDALLAHELAHVEQQRGAAGEGAGEPGAAHEHDADQAATGVMARLYTGVTGAIGAMAGRAAPAMTSGLALQRCVEPKPIDVLSPEEARHQAAILRYQIQAEPSNDTAVVGSSVTFRAQHDVPVMGGYAGIQKWVIHPPDDTYDERNPAEDGSLTVTFDRVGRWQVLALVSGLGDTPFLIDRFQEVKSIDDRASDALAAAKKQTPGSYEEYRANLALTGLDLAGHPQNPEEGARVTTSAPNPLAAPERALGGSTHTFLVEPVPEATAFRWYVLVPESIWAQHLGQYEGIYVDGEGAAFDLGSGKHASFAFHRDGEYTVVCEQFDAAGKALGKLRYRQVVLSAEAHARLGVFEKQVAAVDERIRKVKEGSEVPVPAVHVTRANGETIMLSLFLGENAGSTSEPVMLLDLTPGAQHIEHPGSDLGAALKHFASHNEYPTGKLELEVTRAPAGLEKTVPLGKWAFETSGATTRGEAAATMGWLSLAAAGMGVAAALIPGTQALAPFFFVAAAELGVGSGVASLLDHLDKAEPTGVEVAIDIASIVSSMLGGLGAGKRLVDVLRRVALPTRAGTYLAVAGFGSDAVACALVTIDGAAKIDDILGGELPRDQKIDAIVRILASLALNGGLLALGAKDLKPGVDRAGKLFGAEGAKGLSAEAHAALAGLGEDAVRSLAKATPADKAQILAFFRASPARTAKLLGEYGDAFVETVQTRPGASLDQIETLVVRDGKPRAPAAGAIDPALTPVTDAAKIVQSTTANVVVGKPLASVAAGEKILHKLAAGDLAAFEDLGLARPKDFDPRSCEWGVGELASGEAVIVKGDQTQIDWTELPGVTGRMHSHPLLDRTKLKGVPSGGVTIAELITSGGPLTPSQKMTNFAHLVPSGADLRYAAKESGGAHVLVTPYEHVGGGRIDNPGAGATGNTVVFHLSEAKLAGEYFSKPEPIYSAKVVAMDQKGVVLWEGTLYGNNVDGLGNVVTTDPTSILKAQSAPSATTAGAKSTASGSGHDQAVLDAIAAEVADPAKQANLTGLPAPVLSPLMDASVPSYLAEIDPAALVHLATVLPPAALKKLFQVISQVDATFVTDPFGKLSKEALASLATMQKLTAANVELLAQLDLPVIEKLLAPADQAMLRRILELGQGPIASLASYHAGAKEIDALVADLGAPVVTKLMATVTPDQLEVLRAALPKSGKSHPLKELAADLSGADILELLASKAVYGKTSAASWLPPVDPSNPTAKRMVETLPPLGGKTVADVIAELTSRGFAPPSGMTLAPVKDQIVLVFVEIDGSQSLVRIKVGPQAFNKFQKAEHLAKEIVKSGGNWGKLSDILAKVTDDGSVIAAQWESDSTTGMVGAQDQLDAWFLSKASKTPTNPQRNAMAIAWGAVGHIAVKP